MNSANHHLQLAADVLRQTYPNPTAWSSPAARAFQAELELLVGDIERVQSVISTISTAETDVELMALLAMML